MCGLVLEAAVFVVFWTRPWAAVPGARKFSCALVPSAELQMGQGTLRRCVALQLGRQRRHAVLLLVLVLLLLQLLQLLHFVTAVGPSSAWSSSGNGSLRLASGVKVDEEETGQPPKVPRQHTQLRAVASLLLRA